MTTELNTDRLVTDLKRIVHDSEKLLHGDEDAVREKATEIRARLAVALEAAKRPYQRWEEHAVDGARTAGKTMRSRK